MLSPRDAAEVLDHEFLLTRSRILDLAAALDRLDRAPERHNHPPDVRLAGIRQALEALLVPEPSRAETIQLIFSLDYDPKWQTHKGPGRAS